MLKIKLIEKGVIKMKLKEPNIIVMAWAKAILKGKYTIEDVPTPRGSLQLKEAVADLLGIELEETEPGKEKE